MPEEGAEEPLVLPALDLKQPNILLARQFAGIRKMRAYDSKVRDPKLVCVSLSLEPIPPLVLLACTR